MAPIVVLHFLLLLPITFSLSVYPNGALEGCYKSIFSFGDSLADTGNLLRIDADALFPPHFALPPYGETFFGCPTGRYSDGRLIIDFIAQYFGLSLVQPYFGSENAISADLEHGLNFAVAGATALDNSFFEKSGMHNDHYTNYSLGYQLLDWFKSMLPSLCQTPSDCKRLLQSALVLMGEIGGNDFNHPFFAGKDVEEIRSYVPPVINTISSAVNGVDRAGGCDNNGPRNFPIGCFPSYQTLFMNSNKEDYNPETGCLTWLNEFSEYYNEMLQIELNRLQELNQHTVIIYADYYSAMLRLIRSPKKYGFTGGNIIACCGAGGPYNFNTSAECGYEPSKACDDPSKFLHWDGIHLTEAAYEWIAKGLLEGPFTIPPLTASCFSTQTGPSAT